MPQAQITDVTGAGAEPLATGAVLQDVCNTTTAAIPLGTLVAIEPPVGANATVFGVGASSAGAATAPFDIGVAVGGASPGSAITPAGTAGAVGGTGQACIHGYCRALVDSSVSPTVLGHRLIRSAATPGALADSGVTTATAGLNYGVVLEAVTIASGTALVAIWFERT